MSKALEATLGEKISTLEKVAVDAAVDMVREASIVGKDVVEEVVRKMSVAAEEEEHKVEASLASVIITAPTIVVSLPVSVEKSEDVEEKK